MYFALICLELTPGTAPSPSISPPAERVMSRRKPPVVLPPLPYKQHLVLTFLTIEFLQTLAHRGHYTNEGHTYPPCLHSCLLNDIGRGHPPSQKEHRRGGLGGKCLQQQQWPAAEGAVSRAAPRGSSGGTYEVPWEGGREGLKEGIRNQRRACRIHILILPNRCGQEHSRSAPPHLYTPPLPPPHHYHPPLRPRTGKPLPLVLHNHTERRQFTFLSRAFRVLGLHKMINGPRRERGACMPV